MGPPSMPTPRWVTCKYLFQTEYPDLSILYSHFTETSLYASFPLLSVETL
ncbi:hypothetical protein HMPREF0262_00101 [Clostridium sp. ATCC 29733]|nr:hypothetical protein HMPREF0262_00101 [Clostridium sp. ATCC 29733]